MGSARQFGALLRKNFILQTRSRKSFFGIGGWGALVLQLLIPVVFFALMCIPKHYIKPVLLPRLVTSTAFDLDSRWWIGPQPYSGPAVDPVNRGQAHLVLVPDVPAVRRLATVLARALACPVDPSKRQCPTTKEPNNFYCMFIAKDTNTTARCQDADACMADASCYSHLFDQQLLRVLPDEAAALALALERPHTVDAFVVFDAAAPPGGETDAGLSSYTLRMNHTDVPPTRFLLDLFDVYPMKGSGLDMWHKNWFFVNLQHQVDRSIIGLAHAAALAPQLGGLPALPSLGTSRTPLPAARRSTLEQHSHRAVPWDGAAAAAAVASAPSFDLQRGGGQWDLTPEEEEEVVEEEAEESARPASIAVQVKAFPWPAATVDLGAASAAAFFNLLLVYAFLAPTRGMVAAVVREKELRLREGMRILGLSDLSYWSSWALTHWLTLTASLALCAVIGTYPFEHTSAVIMLGFFWIMSAALVAFSYALSTLFGSSRVAGTAAQFFYVLAMIPGFVLPTIEPYGGPAWFLACLSPPSAASLFAQALLSWEASAQGINGRTFWLPLTQSGGFSVASIFWLLAVDVVLYGGLAWYLDKVLPQAVGVRRPPWFFLLPSYWRPPTPTLKDAGGDKGDVASPDAGGASSLSQSLLPVSGNGGGSKGGGGAAVRVRRLRKVFPLTAGGEKVALDDVDLDFEAGRITALLGHNGAGKTTIINILTGMLAPTSGSATLGGRDMRRDMDAIRHSLGVCPQFDILWPDMTVAEHLHLYAALKGLARQTEADEVRSAAAEVGLDERMDVLAGDLSGGQRRKLSVAVAFLGRPAVAFLDEPTSGMDPYSRRFTWDVIRSHRRDCAIVLTTHSMEEADVLADSVVVMAHGRVAARGSAMELKRQFGLGYTLTLVLSPEATAGLREARTLHRNGGSSTNSLAAAAGSGGTAPGSGRGSGSGTGGEEAQVALRLHSRLAHEVTSAVPGAQLLSAAGAEVSFRLPREQSASFAPLLRRLDGQREALQVGSYGLSVTTLEEVFLRITNCAAEADEALDKAKEQDKKKLAAVAGAAPGSSASAAEATAVGGAGAGGEEESGQQAWDALPQAQRLRGWRLYCHQVHGLFIKRALCSRRDRLALLTQLAVPLFLVWMGLWVLGLSVQLPKQPTLPLTRGVALFGRPALFAASAALRAAAGGGPRDAPPLDAFMAAWPEADLVDCGASALYTGGVVDGTSLDGQLLRRWSTGLPHYDALFVQSLPTLVPPNVSHPAGALAALSGGLQYVLMLNQSAVSALPAALSQANTAALRYLLATAASTAAAAGSRAAVAATGASVHLMRSAEVGGTAVVAAVAAAAAAAADMAAAGLHVASAPLPTLNNEAVVRIEQSVGGLMLVLCMMLSSSVLSASFVIFLVRERDNNSKHVQVVSGATVTAFWAANLLWDLINFAIPAAGIVALVASKGLAQFGGERLPALSALLALFGLASLALTYLLHFAFQDEMKALQRLNTAYFLVGYLGFLFVWISDLILLMVANSPNLKFWNGLGKTLLRTFSPHYCFGKGLFDITQTAPGAQPFPGAPSPGSSPWPVVRTQGYYLAIQAVVYGSLVLVIDSGVLTVFAARAWRSLAAKLRRSGAGRAAAARQQPGTAVVQQGPGGSGGGGGGDPEAGVVAAAADAVDEDVESEQLAVQRGERTGSQVLLDGVDKRYPQGLLRAPLVAVDSLWLGVPSGECFGLLGVNGAGKTTTFRMLTGEVLPDAGDALVCGVSVVTSPWAARQLLGYCPQFEALPGAMTGREVLHLYARLRGVPSAHIRRLASHLLSRLGLTRQADNVCSAYSGGTKRKLSVAVSLVGDPPVVLLDEPSTGMDPSARRFLWTLLQREVLGAGRTVVLTSHSMEECEALCTSVGILVAGRLRCLGTVQHLKGRFGSGYALELKTDLTTGAVAKAQVSEYVSRLCPAASLAEHDGQRFVFSIPRNSAELADVFEALEARPATLGISDYSVAQATLEQVFITLAAGSGGRHRSDELGAGR